MEVSMLDQKEIYDIRKKIIDGVHAAKKGGIVCDYPNDFTVESIHNGKKVSVTYPIWNEEYPKLK
jgi:hypothetical protein